MSLASLLNTLVTLQRPAITKDTSGGSVRSFQDVSGVVEVIAAVQPASHREKQTFAARQLFISHVVYFDADRDVRRGDRIFHPATAGSESGKYYVVLSYHNQAGRGRVFAAYVREQMA